MAPDPDLFFNRELSWLAFVRRVLSMAEHAGVPLLERVKFAGITAMLHDEFYMKRISGLKRRIRQGSKKTSLDGKTPEEELEASLDELAVQIPLLGQLVENELRPALRKAGVPLLGHSDLDDEQRRYCREYFIDNVQPILTPLAVDAEHPFPFISGGPINLAALIPDNGSSRSRFVRIKVPDNRPRWVPLPADAGIVPLEQIIAANLDLLFPAAPPKEVHFFRVTRGAMGKYDRIVEAEEIEELDEPGSIIHVVSEEVKARRFAGVERLQVDSAMPEWLTQWLCRRLEIEAEDVYRCPTFLGLSDLLKAPFPTRPDLRDPPHDPGTHPRLRKLPEEAGAIFEEIDRGDILLHHPYDSFDTSVLRFLDSAAKDPSVLAIKLTIYRTNSDSPIVKALADAARAGKQVAVLVEITAKFDEAPNIAWGQYLENEGVHVSYGVERLKTHVKLALVVREEAGNLRRYAHIGTGNYHTGTARIYEDFGILTCDAEICRDVAAVFNELTGATANENYRQLLVAPRYMRSRFIELIGREIEHAEAGRPSGVYAKMNQLRDKEIIQELYRASQAGVPVELNVRGFCCLRPGVAGMSDNIRVYGVVGRFLEHSRIFRFENGGGPEFFLGSADWMNRNLNNRVETIAPVRDASVRQELEAILEAYRRDNWSVWDCGPDGVYVRREPKKGEERISAQEEFIRLAAKKKRGKGLPAQTSSAA